MEITQIQQHTNTNRTWQTMDMTNIANKQNNNNTWQTMNSDTYAQKSQTITTHDNPWISQYKNGTNDNHTWHTTRNNKHANRHTITEHDKQWTMTKFRTTKTNNNSTWQTTTHDKNANKTNDNNTWQTTRIWTMQNRQTITTHDKQWTWQTCETTNHNQTSQTRRNGKHSANTHNNTTW